jgi:hypothetical protein
VIRRAMLWAPLGLAAALVAGCGSDKAPSGGSTPSASGTATSASASASASGAASSTAASGKPAADRVDALKGALLTAAEVGTGFTGGPTSPSADTGPCNKEPVQKHLPNNTEVDASFSRGDGNSPDTASVDQSVIVYPDAAQATTAYDWNAGELGCRHGSVEDQGQKVAFTIGAPVDVTAQVGGDKAMLWNISFDAAPSAAKIVFVAVRVKDAVVDLGFTTGPNATGMRSVPAVVKTAVDKLTKA